MRALIADDEAPARSRVRRLLEAAGDVEIVGEAATGRQAVAAIKRSRPDIIFLDIQMPGLDGFGVLDAIDADGAPYVVFVTAHDQHALKAFEAGVVDYLLKPFTPERFARVLDRARARLAAPSDASTERAAGRASEYLRRLLVMSDGRATFLAVERIDRVDAERNYIQVQCGAERFRLRAAIASIAARLDPGQFLRVNRSTVVRLDAVKAMHEWSHGDYRIVMQDGAEVVWSRRYRAGAQLRFGVDR